MPDEDVILDDYALTDKGVTGNLAALPYRGILLDFYECSNLCLVPDLTAIQIYKLREPYISPEPDVA